MAVQISARKMTIRIRSALPFAMALRVLSLVAAQ